MTAKIGLAEAANKQAQVLREVKAAQNQLAAYNLQSLESSLDDLRRQMKDQSDAISKLQVEEQKLHKRDSSSSFKRLTAKLTGKERSKGPSAEETDAQKELTQKINDAKAVRESMFSTLKETEEEKKNVVAATEKLASASKELDEIYANAFDGPTPDIAGEDELEKEVETLASKLMEASNSAAGETRAQKFMSEATRLAADADQQIVAAASYFDAERELLGSKKPSKSHLEDLQFQQSLRMMASQQDLERARWNYTQASREQPLIPMNPVEGNAEGEEVQRKFGEAVGKDKFTVFEAARASHNWSMARMEQIFLEQKQRTSLVTQAQTDAAKALDESRQKLFDLRQTALKEYSSQ